MKLFRIPDYYENMRAIVSYYNLKGKVDIWWEVLKNTIAVSEKKLTWEEIEKLFKKHTYLNATTTIRKKSSMNSKFVR